MEIDYSKELKEYVTDFIKHISKVFTTSTTIKYNLIEEIKVEDKFGYTLEEKTTNFVGKPLIIEEFPFKWGFNGNTEYESIHSPIKRHFMVANKLNMKYIYEQTLKEKEKFFNAITAKLLLNDYIAILYMDESKYYETIVKQPVVDNNSSVFGSIDYIEYVFKIVVFENKNK